MSCLICAGPAQRIPCEGRWEERDCAECGRYRISDSLVLALMEQGQIFDVLRMRAWLSSRQGNGEVPCVEIEAAVLQP